MNNLFNKKVLPAFALVGSACIGHLFSKVNKDSKYNIIPVLFVLSATGSWVPYFGSIGFVCGLNSYRFLGEKSPTIIEEDVIEQEVKEFK